MLSRYRKSRHTIGLGFVALTALVYLYQLVPHAHALTQDLDSSEHDAVHATHTHSHDNEEATSQDEAHHHHDLSQHLDFHSSRNSSRGIEFRTDLSIDLVSIDPVSGTSSSFDWMPEQKADLPTTIVLSNSNPRAPPVSA
jgi:hypothetical protein